MSKEVATMSFGDIEIPQNTSMPVPVMPGALVTNITNGVISAQRVDVKRDYVAIMQNLKALATVMTTKYYYFWETKNKDGTKGKVEGGTIKLAMDIARIYGNCQVDCRVEDKGDRLEFYARFVDIETGFSLTRPFIQRKDQNLGMKDKARAADIVLQIGASKAIRNVVLDSLPNLEEFAVQEAKKGLLERVNRNPEGAKQAILGIVNELQIDVKRIEAIIGRNAEKWTNADLAKLWVQLDTIKDGYSAVDDIFPLSEKIATQNITENKGTKGLKEKLKSKETINAETGEVTEAPVPNPPKEETSFPGDASFSAEQRKLYEIVELYDKASDLDSLGRILNDNSEHLNRMSQEQRDMASTAFNRNRTRLGGK